MSTFRLVVVAACVLASSALAQDRARGSRNLSVDSWAYDYVRRLLDRGYLSNLNPLVQPYRRSDIARGLAQLGPDTLPQPVGHWVRLLQQELAAELAEPRASDQARGGVEAMAGARGSTSRRLDPLRPLGSRGAWPWWRAGGWVETGPLAGETRLHGDRYFNDDPDGMNPGQNRGGRSDNAYLSVALPFGGLMVGRLARNWGPVGTPGLMVSDVATPYPQLGLDLTAGRFTLRSFTGELDTVLAVKRYLAAHRLDYRGRDLAVSFGESSVYAGPGQGVLLRFLNPAEFLFFDADQAPYDLIGQNVMLDTQVWLRRGGAVFYLEGLLDDIDVNPTSFPAEPPQYGFTLGARLVSLPPWIDLALEYQQVGAWSYRTNHGLDRYSYLNRGLGANYSDYDRLSVAANLYPPLPGLRISPKLAVQRQGEGNFRDPTPGGSYAGRAALFYGVTERIIRLGLAGRYQPFRALWVDWDIGPNFVRNQDHNPGVAATEFSGVAQVGVRLAFPRWKRER